ncbi:hypothetical protein I6A95_000185 [Clostridioides difficile]
MEKSLTRSKKAEKPEKAAGGSEKKQRKKPERAGTAEAPGPSPESK